MIESVNKMITHLMEYPRLAISEAVLRTIGIQPAKTQWFEHVFTYHTAMVIWRGSGTLWHRGKHYDLEAPVLFLARPGEYYSYGPVQQWHEYHFIFSHPSPEILDPQKYPLYWPVQTPELVQSLLQAVERLVQNAAMPGMADQLDMLARLIVFSSYHSPHSPIQDPITKRIFAAERWMQVHLTEDFEIEALAGEFGFSPASFRRHWKRHFSQSPRRHLIELRLQEAERLLLAMPGATIAEVAYQCGFSDQRYFATLFRRHSGLSPTGFREHFQQQ